MGLQLPGVSGEGGSSSSKGKQQMLLVGAIGLGLLLLLGRRRASTPVASTATPSSGGSLEFARLVAANSAELERLRVDASLQMQSEQLRYELSAGAVPGLNSTFISADAYGQMTAAERQQFRRQINEGKLIAQPVSGGYRITPTGEGFAGHTPPTRSECKSGLLGGRCRNVGLGQAPVPRQPAIVDLTREVGSLPPVRI